MHSVHTYESNGNLCNRMGSSSTFRTGDERLQRRRRSEVGNLVRKDRQRPRKGPTARHERRTRCRRTTTAWLNPTHLDSGSATCPPGDGATVRRRSAGRILKRHVDGQRYLSVHHNCRRARPRAAATVAFSRRPDQECRQPPPVPVQCDCSGQTWQQFLLRPPLLSAPLAEIRRGRRAASTRTRAPSGRAEFLVNAP